MSAGSSGETARRPASADDRRRLFFALWPDEAVRLAILHATRKLARQSGGRPITPDKVHVTLVFLGGIAARRVGEIERIASEVAGRPFEVEFDRLEYWQRARVLCLVPSNTPPALVELVKDLNSRLEAAGFEIERRPFRAHLTVARKVARPVDCACPRLVYPACDFVLVESRTVSAGSQYQVVGRWPLVAAS